MNIQPAKNGFTLIELIVVATIAAILMTIGIVSFQSANMKSRDTKRKSDLEQIRSSLEMYRTDNSSYPASADLNSDLVPQYISAIPSDPKAGNPVYKYIPTGSNPYYTYTLEAKIEGNGSNCSDSSYNYCVYNP
jgi:general secretion pathway protein G